MGRSNNQRRKWAKEHGGTYIPKTVKSRTRNQLNVQRVQATTGTGPRKKKLAYKKIVTKHGKVKDRKFKAGGYNKSGKHGSARGSKSKKSSGAGSKKKN